MSNADALTNSTTENIEHGGSMRSGAERNELLSVHPIIRQIIDRDCHVASSFREVVRYVISKLKGGFQTFRNMNQEDRQLFIDQCLQQHAANRQLYTEVMSGMQRTTIRRSESRLPPTMMTGPQLVSMMRKHHVTIAGLAERTGITQKRIRQVRERGLSDPMTIRDWIDAITREAPGPIPASIRIGIRSAKAECDFCGYPFVVGDDAWTYVEEVFCTVNCCRISRNWLK